MFKNPSFIFDILCTVVWLVLAVRYARKGFLASVVQLTGSLISLFGARAFSGWAAGQVFERFLAGSFRDQIAANIAAGGAVSLDGIAQRYAGFLPEAFRASIVDACERSSPKGRGNCGFEEKECNLFCGFPCQKRWLPLWGSWHDGSRD